MTSKYAFLSLFSLVGATLTIQDPSDTITSSSWLKDNAILADYNVPPILYQIIPTIGKYMYNSSSTTVSHEYLTVDKNDTSMVVITDGAKVNIDYSTIVKFGYASNLLQSSFYGTNATVNVANGSIAQLSDINITTHNGAANLYSFGTGTVAYVKKAWLYSSGPVAHGLYAGGNGTVYGSNVEDFDYFASYSDNPMLSPAHPSIFVQDSRVAGDLVAYNGSSVAIALSQYSSWVGKAYSGFGKASFGVSLDRSSTWTLTGNVGLQNFTDADTTLSNIKSHGFNITYNPRAPANKAWGGKTFKLPGGGYAAPK